MGIEKDTALAMGGVMVTCNNNPVKNFRRGTLAVEIYKDEVAAGEAAAGAAALALRRLGRGGERIPVIFATGGSQVNLLRRLTEIGDLPWNQVQAFHMDEYVGIGIDHHGSFCRYLDEKLRQRAQIRQFFFIDGAAPDPARICADYAEKVRSANPRLCFLGIGENGHLAFNDPHAADFNDPLDMKLVRLDAACREQQAAEGWFESVEQVPEFAMTLTIPILLRVPQLIVTVPGTRKAAIVRRTLEEPVSTDCPATILRTHPNATLYLDLESAAELGAISNTNSFSTTES
jgi:glucosamine-6-phosphate deaminase